ncbi:V-type ATPase, V0 complex, 116kDa subunit family [Mycena amicta]|nr:V-type ATPase, V0 complex, 116kDa subunit family [Mycena amicta]
MTHCSQRFESMGATLYPIDANADQRAESLREVTVRLEDLQTVLYNTGMNHRSELVKIGESLRSWQNVVRKEKLIYEALNLFNYDVRRETLIAEGWVPTRDIPEIQLTLRRATEHSGTSMTPTLHELHTSKTPPTYNRTNRFTEGFQLIMDSYGIASYQEVNPGLFAIITFPFLFAVMFGDIGHGFIIFCAALYMIMVEKKWAKQELDEIVGQFFTNSGRYIILLMGLFSMYTGLIYNDIFSKSLHLWHSGWDFPEPGNLTRIPAVANGHTYPFGLDSGWHGAENMLVFTNSYKMKMSVVLGVIHMTFALCLQVPNHIRFKRPIDIYFNFIPQMIFLQSVFGYLVVCIRYKWSIDWEVAGKTGSQPPALLNMLISMFLTPGTIDPPEAALSRTGRCTDDSVADGGGVCADHARRQAVLCLARDEGTRGHGNGGAVVEDGSGDEEHEEHDFSDVVIHQVIHTIEFCLGCISHTASYLRLWALSLAHAQLSEVLWTMILEDYLHPTGIGGWIALAIGGFMWFNLTVGILCVMEGLSAFLHALRLHWVEANSKHFEGGGYVFTPLTFAE